MCRLLLPLHLDLTVKSKVFTSKRRFEHDYLTVYIRLAFFFRILHISPQAFHHHFGAFPNAYMLE